MKNDKKSPKESAALFDAMTKAFVKGDAKPLPNLNELMGKRFQVINSGGLVGILERLEVKDKIPYAILCAIDAYGYTGNEYHVRVEKFYEFCALAE
jgi:hypothetical protein